jgi:hypothetical protein
MGLSGSEGGVSVYGSGIQASTGSIIQCNTNDICLTRELLSFFYWSIQRSQDVVEQLFPATTATSAFVTKIQAFAWMNDYTFVRFVWLQEHPGQLFYTTNVIHRYELLDIYLRFNLTSWGTDPDVKDLLPRE